MKSAALFEGGFRTRFRVRRQPWFLVPRKIGHGFGLFRGHIDAKEHAMAMCNLAKLLGWAGKHAEAYQASREALGLHADLPAIQYQAGLAAYLMGNTEQAQEHYRQALVLAPEYGDAHCNLGVVLEKAGDLETARFHFQKALEHGSTEYKTRDQENLQRVEASLKELK